MEMKNEPFGLVVSLAVLSTHPLREILTSNALSFGASSVSANHIAPWKWICSPAATHELSATSSEVNPPSLSLTFNHPNPNVLLTLKPVEDNKSRGANPAEPELSKHPVLNLTSGWSGNSLVTWNIQCISKIPLFSTLQELASISIKSSGSFGSGNTSPFSHVIVGFLAIELVNNVRVALVIEVADSPITCLVTTS